MSSLFVIVIVLLLLAIAWTVKCGHSEGFWPWRRSAADQAARDADKSAREAKKAAQAADKSARDAAKKINKAAAEANKAAENAARKAAKAQSDANKAAAADAWVRPQVNRDPVIGAEIAKIYQDTLASAPVFDGQEPTWIPYVPTQAQLDMRAAQGSTQAWPTRQDTKLLEIQGETEELKKKLYAAKAGYQDVDYWGSRYYRQRASDLSHARLAVKQAELE